MYLKSLLLKGFKSFSEATLIELTPGINVIVGPNGSGKSNIVDAISWVLGTQTPKALRSQKMDDVIFSGNQAKSPDRAAKVTMVLDNATNHLRLDLAEVAFTRILMRSGESSYELNGRECRLIDLTELLGDASIGRGLHTIIGQGNLDSILDSKPEERRVAIEDASGIAKFRRRQERTKRRLEVVGQEAERADEMLKDLRKRIRPLERQAQAAKRHLDLADEISQLKAYILGSEYRGYLEIISQSGESAATLDAEVALANSRIELMRSELEQREATEDRLDESTLVELLNNLIGFQGCTSVLVTKVVERLRSIDEQITSISIPSKVPDLESGLANLIAEREAIEARVLELGPTLDELERRESVNLERSQLINIDQVRDAEVRERELTGAQRVIFARVSKLRSDIALLDHDRENYARQSDQARSQLESALEKLQALEAVSATLDIEESSSKQQLTEAQENLSVATLDAELVDAQLLSVRESRAQAQGAVASLEASLEILHSRTNLAIVQSTSDPLGVIVELIDIEPGYEDIVEAGLSPIGLSIVVPDLDRAIVAYTSIKKHSGTARVVVANRLAGLGIEPVKLDKLVHLSTFIRTCHSSVASIVHLTLANSYYFDGEPDELASCWPTDPSMRIITRSRDVVKSYGLEFSGDETIVTQATIAQARSTLDDETVNLRGLEAEALRKTNRKFELAKRADLVAKEVGMVEARRMEVIRERDRENEKLTASQLIVESMGLRLSGIAQEFANLGEQANEAETEMEIADQRVRELRGLLDLARKDVAEFEIERRELHQERSGLEIAIVRLQERHGHCVQAIQATEVQVDQARRFDSDRDRRISGLIASRVKYETIATQFANPLGRLGSIREALDARIREIAIVNKNYLDDVSARRSALEEAVYLRSLVQERLTVGRERSRDATIRAEVMAERIWRELELAPEIAMNIPILPGVDNANTDSHLERLQNELTSLGPINQLAAHELIELYERQNFLEAQLSDINVSVTELRGVSREIEKEMRQVFIAALEDVDRHFATFFGLLFPGGAAKIVLSLPDSPLESGLEFDLAIPGKNLKRLALLSGGERSLVALAFLFAIFRSRPSPFYVLDEVEAALDDSNLTRLLSMLSEFGRHAQVIIISHQKRTMEIAHTLVGVSSSNDGLSKVVSENLSKRQLPFVVGSR